MYDGETYYIYRSRLEIMNPKVIKVLNHLLSKGL